MIRTIIADNEVWICRLLESMVDWNALGFELVALAHSGDQLLEAARGARPDLIITDIEMPGMNGLEVLRTLRNEEQPFEAMILSGYSEFAYAKEAIDLGVFCYLLKPVDAETLTEKLNNFKESFHASGSSDEDITLLKERLDYTSRQYFYAYFRTVLNGDPVTMTLDQINQQFGRTFSEGRFSLIALSIDSRIPGRTIDDKVYTYYCETVRNTMKHICFDLTHISMNPYWFILLNYDPDNAALLESALSSLTSGAEGMPTMMSARTTLGLGLPVSELRQILISYRTSIRALHARFMMPQAQMIDSRSLPDVTLQPGQEARNKLQTFINARVTPVTAAEIVSLILDQESLQYPYAPFELSAATMDLAMAALPEDAVSQDPVNSKNLSEKTTAMFAALEHAGSFDQLKRTLERNLEEIRSLNTSLSKESSEIEQIRSYIQEHLTEDISLSDLAELVHYNPNYLSDYFKKETGETVNRYITQLRLEKAKDLLADDSLKCKDVARMVGYRDFNYFTRVFKNAVGVTPKDYRKIFLRR